MNMLESGNTIYAFSYVEGLDMVCLSVDYYGVTYSRFLIDTFFFVPVDGHRMTL